MYKYIMGESLEEGHWGRGQRALRIIERSEER
jgi:hypothetical protein